MAYTSTQLIAAYTAANDGVAPDAATTILLGGFATQTQTGQLADSAALAYVINSADKTTAVANLNYQFFTAKTPTKAGLDFLVNSTTNATDLNDPYYAAFNIENRYMNFAANLGLIGEGATAFNTTYSSTAIPLFSTFIGVIYEQIIGSSYAAAAGINVTAALNDVIGRQAAFTQIARERGMITSASTAAQIDIATRAVAVGYLLVEGIKADVGVYAAGSNNLTAAMVNGTAQYNVNLLTTYSPLGGGTGSPVSNGSPVTGGIPGSTFAFTAGIDGLVGTANDDTFNAAQITGAQAVGTIANTFQAADTANGGAGIDTLNITVTDITGAGATGNVAIAAAGISAIENINVRSITTGGGDTFTLVGTNFSGATSFTNDRSTNGLTLTGLASGQAIGINGLGGGTVVGGITSADYSVAATTVDTAFSTVLNLAGGTGSSATVGPNVTVQTSTGAVLTATINSNGTVANVAGNIVLDNGNANFVRTLNIKADANLRTGNVTGLGGAISGTNAAVTTETIAVTGNGNVVLGRLDGATANTINTLNITTGPGTFSTTGIGYGADGLVTGAEVSLFNANATINVSGGATTTTANAAAVTLGGVVGTVATINASGLTVGGVAANLGMNLAVTFTGGNGTDVVSLLRVVETQTVSVTGPLTANGTVTYLGGTTAALTTGSTDTQIADAITAVKAAIIAANPRITNVSNTAGVLTITYGGTGGTGDVANEATATNNGVVFGTGVEIVKGFASNGLLTGAINGGAGTDIVAFASGTDLVAGLTSLVTGFEILRVGGSLINQVYDTTLITGATQVQVQTGTGVVLNNLAAAPTITVIGNQTTSLTVNLKDANPGTSDVVSLSLNNLNTSTGAAGVTIDGLALGGTATAGQVETLNIASAGRYAATSAWNAVTLAAGAGPNFVDANQVNITGANGMVITTGAVQHAQNIDASANTFGVHINNNTAQGAGGQFNLIGSAKNDTITSIATAAISSGGGGDSILLNGNGNANVQTLVYKAASESQLDLAGSTQANLVTGNGGVGVTVNSTTAGASTMDIINGFNTGVDKINVSAFGFGAGGLGGGIGGNGTAGGITVITDAALTAALANANLFSDGISVRGLAVIHATAALGTGVAGDFLIIDVNKDGLYAAGSDIVVKLTGTVNAGGAASSLTIADFVI